MKRITFGKEKVISIYDRIENADKEFFLENSFTS